MKKKLRKCIVCLKLNARSLQQLMADLPAARVNVSRVFSQVGLDFCGPFQVKTLPGRCKQVRKCFIAIFVYFSIKAIHLE